MHDLDDVLNRGVGAGDDVRVDLEAVARHADGVAHALLAVDGELLRQHVHDAPLGGHADRSRGVDGAVHVLVANLAMSGGDGDHTAAVLRGDVPAGDTDHRRVDRDPGHLLGHVDRLGDRLGGAVDLDHRTLADAPGGDDTDTQDSETGALQVG